MYCKCICIKAGFQKNGSQKFYCKSCKRYQQESYRSYAHQADCNSTIKSLLKEGIALRGIARILKITLKTVISKIKMISAGIKRPLVFTRRSIYEMDELWTFTGNKKNEVWVMYALESPSGRIINFKVGSRNKNNLRELTDLAVQQDARAICTDGLITYRSLIQPSLHKIGLSHTRNIERFNLNLRTHLKRLSRKTICFSRSVLMLEACLKIYFWS